MAKCIEIQWQTLAGSAGILKTLYISSPKCSNQGEFLWCSRSLQVEFTSLQLVMFGRNIRIASQHSHSYSGYTTKIVFPIQAEHLYFFCRLKAEKILLNTLRTTWTYNNVDTTSDYLSHHGLDGVKIILQPD